MCHKNVLITCKDKKYVNIAGNAIELISFHYIYALVGNERELQARTEKKDKRIIEGTERSLSHYSFVMAKGEKELMLKKIRCIN